MKDDVITSRRVELTKHYWTASSSTFLFSLTPVGERRAALFGGRSGSGVYSDDLLIIDLSKDTVVSVIV